MMKLLDGWKVKVALTLAMTLLSEVENERMNFLVEFLSTVNISGMPSHKLTLKKGTIVML